MGFIANLLGLPENKKAGIREEINIMDAINAHVSWKIRLDKYLKGSSQEQFDPAVVSRDDQCALGKWIHGPAQNHFHDEDGLRTLREDHAEFHLIVGRVLSSVQSRDMAAAAALMKDEYLAASHKVVHALTELNKHINE